METKHASVPTVRRSTPASRPCVVVALTLGLAVAMAATGGRGIYAECVSSESTIPRTRHLTAEEVARFNHGEVVFHLIGIVVTAPVAVWLFSVSTTPYLCRVSEYLGLLWANQWSGLAAWWLQCDGIPSSGPLMLIYNLTFVSSMAYFWVLVARQMRTLEVSCFLDLGTRCLWRCLAAGCVLGIVGSVMFNLAGGPPGSPSRLLASACVWSGAFVMLVGLKIFLHGFRQVLTLTQDARNGALASGTEESQKAPNSLRFQMVGTTLGAMSTIVGMLSRYWLSDLLWPVPAPVVEQMTPELLVVVTRASSLVDTVLNVVAGLALSGVFFGALSGGKTRVHAERARHQTWRRSAKAYTPHVEAGWQSKVEELAGRGISLQTLIDFYRGLGKHAMPHYSPLRHTTEDVVWEAIIPLSAASQSSMAEVLSSGPVKPDTMVTHNWGNLFVDLVAAIVANSLGEKDYHKVEFLLINDMDTLQRWVEERGVGRQTFWICAFSVNQHSSICATRTERKDPVTCEKHPICGCGAPKILSTTPPLSAEGHSVACEMNKFDHMMLLISSRNERFKHIVAVDRQFSVFSRAWCIAEISAAHSMGMHQSLELPSRLLLQRNLDNLAGLRIRDMEASRPEDKAEILSRIPDQEAFDRDLRDLLLGQLIPFWSKLDSSDQMHRAGCIARWQLAWREKREVWESSFRDEDSPAHTADKLAVGGCTDQDAEPVLSEDDRQGWDV